ncbi:UPF0481 protein At3g47200-like [Telopea speciosissima]|uniref:UPF0481 protein At3g47200-like n=1 Tax=Telopea speciosissima TaxID=54955 RepID=UPI001CC74722|nr:UPF0481 protein At3g47200-like [Telopea speciosissima]
MARTNERHSISNERSEKRTVVIERFHEGSRDSTEPDIIVDECERPASVITETSTSGPQWLLSILCEQETPETKAGIDKVPTILRDIEKHKDCFDPMVVSIGPYHKRDKDKDGKPKFDRVEKLKASIAKEFIGGDSKKLLKFDEVSRNARAYYEKTSTADFSDDQFTSMMFLDGCFVLHFIDCLLNQKSGDTKMKTDQIAFVLRDLFLLENQLPFLVLQALMSFKHSENEWLVLIHKFVKIPLRLQNRTSPERDDKPAHLLDLLRKKLIEMRNDDWHSFRSVIELKKAGIKCKKINGGSLRDIKFEDRFISGDLFLPQLFIDDSTKPILLNLVAYEASPDGPSDYVVASYIVLLDALIDHPEDVKELRSKGILQNLLGSDQQVADLFNELSINLVPSSSEYLEVKRKIEKYNKNKISIWMTDFRRTHFSSPWTIVAFFVAGSIILLTFAQTYFSIFPRGDDEGERKAPTPSRKIYYT